jgi:aldehyde:ferredoxin oxidoreductase
MATVKEQVTRCKKDPHFKEFSKRGTQNPEFTNILGIFPTRNFREGELTAWEKIESSEWDKLRVRKTHCHNCMLHCGSVTKVLEGKYRNAWTEGPEYETIWAFAGAVDSADIGLSVAADHLCDDLGLDTISTGVAIGLAYELYEKGIIDRKDTGGLELVYGQDAPVLTLIKQIARRNELGDLLAEGVRAAARRVGQAAEPYAMHVKGLEIPGYDPRGAKAQGLSMMTTNIGADHCSGYAPQEIFGAPFFGKKIDRFAVEGKAELAKYNQDMRTLYGFGIMCNFASRHMDPELMGRYLKAATGVAKFADVGYLWLAAERVFNLERMFNVREGFRKKDDRFPARFTEETMSKGAAAGHRFEATILRGDYYRARGWDLETGIPTKETLARLGLEYCM